ncbi:MAG: tRNA(Met) cytidine acetyltransferase [Planctomycetota bacterium]
MSQFDIDRWMSQLSAQLEQSQQRQLVSIQGTKKYCDDLISQLDLSAESTRVFSNRAICSQAVLFSAADTTLGSECQLVIVDLFTGLNADVFCIASGLLAAGGVLILISPGIEEWVNDDDRYAQWQDGSRSAYPVFVDYFLSAIKNDPLVGIVIDAGSTMTAMPSLPELHRTPVVNDCTTEQSKTLQALQQWFDYSVAGTALISADRGRGKSTCLGMFAGQLQNQFQHKGDFNIVVTSASRKSVAQLLAVAGQVSYRSADELILSAVDADLVIVDEAAMLPQSMLRQICRIFPKVAMATTLGGYEGTGQGFLLRFVADHSAEALLHLSLLDPVRWCKGDLLEQWINQTLLMDEVSKALPPETLSDKNWTITVHQQLSQRERQLLVCRVYRLLSDAHYRTRPSDLRMMMENPDLVMITAQQDDEIIAAALLNLEGGFEHQLSDDVFMGKRRPRGHLLAQMITAQAAYRGFACYRGLRVQRVAVQENRRRQGLGSQLIEQAVKFARQKKLDYIGASFAFNHHNAAFWRQLKFDLVHISYAAGKSSGLHSVAVIQPLNEALSEVKGQLIKRFNFQLTTWMTQFLKEMNAPDVVALLRYSGFCNNEEARCKTEIDAFTLGNRGFELCFACLQAHVMGKIASSTGDIDPLLIEKAVQNRHWQMIPRGDGSEGRKQLQLRLRGLVADLTKD